MKFLKFRDAAGYARNTLKGECIQLMHYFEFLEERGTHYEEVTIDDLARFVGWLKNPDIEKKIVAFRQFCGLCEILPLFLVMIHIAL